MCSLSFFFSFFFIFHSQQPSLDRRYGNFILTSAPFILWLYPHMHRTSGIPAPGIRSPALSPSLAPFCFFLASSKMFSIPSSCLPRLPFISSASSVPLFCPHTRWTRIGVRFRALSFSSTLSSLFSFFFYLFYFTRTYFLHRAYRASQRTIFMGFPEIKRIPCWGPGVGEVSLKSERCQSSWKLTPQNIFWFF